MIITKNSFFIILLLSITGLAQASGKVPDQAFEKIANNTWVIHGPLGLPNPKNKGFMNNPAVIKTSKGLVIVDPGSSVQIGEMVLRMAKKISDQPVVAVFNTHIHGDHWLGNHAIRNAYPKAKIYGHPKMIEAIDNGEGTSWVKMIDQMTEGASRGTKVVAPGNKVDNGDVIKVGNNTFKIHHYGKAHTITDIMIEVVEESVVFLGDNVLNNRMPRMVDGSFTGNIATIDSVLKTNVKTWVPGHGKTGDATVPKQFRDYLNSVYQTAKKAFNDDIESSEVKPLIVKATSKFSKWSDYEEQIGKHASLAYLEVEANEF